MISKLTLFVMPITIARISRRKKGKSAKKEDKSLPLPPPKEGGESVFEALYVVCQFNHYLSKMANADYSHPLERLGKIF